MYKRNIFFLRELVLSIKIFIQLSPVVLGCFRLNFQKSAMHSLRLARNHSTSVSERLVYEGWLLYDSGHREEALAKAEESIAIQRSFEAFFLKAYALSNSSTDTESLIYVTQLYEEALRCPSDGLRKGQVCIWSNSVILVCTTALYM